MTNIDWPEIHRHVLPALLPGALFDRLSRVDLSCVLVAGCQRSGTRWLTKLLGAALPNAIAPKELDGCRFLAGRGEIPSGGASVLILQTTFANIETESYARLPERIPVILLVRNPFSVCWSLVYNWQNLTLEHAYRVQTLRDEDRVAIEPEPWRMALELYRQSMRAGIQILQDRPRRTRLLVYDELIQNVPIGLQGISEFLAMPTISGTPQIPPDPRTPNKHLDLPLPFRMLIAEHCELAFDHIKETAALLGSQIRFDAVPGAEESHARVDGATVPDWTK